MITMNEPIYFNGTNILTVPGLMVTATDVNRYPEKNVNRFDVAYSDNSAFTSAFYSGKKLSIDVVITRPSREDLDSSIRALKKIFKANNKTLQLPVAGEQRQFKKVTVDNMIFRNMNGGYAEIGIDMTASDPYNYAVSTTSALDIVNQTSASISYPVSFQGSAPQVPVITINIDSVTVSGFELDTITVSNPELSSELSIEYSFLAGQEIVIVCGDEGYVTVDETPVPYTGKLPYWNDDNEYFNYRDTFFSRQIDMTVEYYRRDE